ncbi:MAG: hypothetical protein E3J66_03485 [Dehalococcoidia bacterium]|nr:MAG: hypothetical protein E3J66_03485 [Dehalococcoidia bacterium]
MAVARGVAVELAKDLGDLEQEQGILTEERSKTLDKMARQLINDIRGIYQKSSQIYAEASSSAIMGSPRQQSEDHDKKVLSTIKKTITEVCTQQPVLSLRWFLKIFRPMFKELTTSSRLLDRWAARHHTAAALHKQDRDTYTPTKIWSRLPKVKWRARFEPYLAEPPPAVVSCPVHKKYYYLGIVILTLGLIGVAVAGKMQSTAIALCGGVVAIWASVLTVLPTKWERCERTPVSQEEEIPKLAPYHPSRQKVPNIHLWVSIIILTLGIIMIGWATLVPSGNSSLAFGLGLVAFYSTLLAVGGFACIHMAEVKAHWPWGVPREKEMPSLAAPPNWKWHVAGLVCLTLAWAALCIWAPRPTINNMLVKAPGLVLILVGVAFVRWPYIGQAQLIYRTPKKPKPLEPSSTEWTQESELMKQAQKISPWIETLLTAPEPVRSDYLEWPESKSEGSILEAFVDQWHKRLADIFRREKSLKEMAKNPQNWAECVVAELANHTVGLADPRYLFALHEVKRWLDGMTWQQLIAELHPDPQWFDFFVARSVPPRWPPTRNDPEVDTSVITVGRALWEIVAPLADPNSSHHLKMVDWQDPYTLLVVRAVQGLENGWRGYPGLPGQRPVTNKEEK